MDGATRYTASGNVEHIPVDIQEGATSIGISVASEGPVHRIVSVNRRLCTSQALQPGDRLVEVNGAKLTTQTHSDVVELVRNAVSAAAGSSISLGVERLPSPKQSGDTLEVLCCSANVGNTKIDPAHLKTWVPERGQVVGGAAGEQYDIIAVGMQECAYKVAGDDSRGGAGNVADDEDGDDGAAAAAASAKSMKASEGGWLTTLGDVALDTCNKHVAEVLGKCLGETEYTLVASVRSLQMRLRVYVKAKHTAALSSVETAKENVGIAGVVGNKGGQVVKFNLYGQSLCFVSAHLPAHEGVKHMQARNKAVVEIMSGARVGNTAIDLGSQFSHAFWMGDLNYRVNIKGLPGNDDCVDDFGKEWSKVKGLVDALSAPGDAGAAALATLQSADELGTLLKEKKVFVGWETPAPTFKPTFKVKRAENLTYIKKRVPSWCDRVLTKSLPGFNSLLRPTIYDACPDYKTSDHKPVRAGYTLQFPHALPPPAERTVEIRLTFAGLGAEIVRDQKRDRFDTPDPYLTFFSDPLDLALYTAANTAGGKGKAKSAKTTSSFGGGSGQVRTATIKNNYTPNWDSVHSEFAVAVRVGSVDDLAGCHLHVVCRDEDMVGADDPLGSHTISLGDVHAASTRGAPFAMKAPLLLNGLESGSIVGTITMEVVGSASASASTAAGTSRAAAAAGGGAAAAARGVGESPPEVTIFGRTGKNAGINGTYILRDLDTAAASPIYTKGGSSGYTLHYYHGCWRVSRKASSVGSTQCIAAAVSNNAADPAALLGEPWRIHVGGQRSGGGQLDARVWSVDRTTTLVRGGNSPQKVLLSGLDPSLDGVFSPTDSEHCGSRVYLQERPEATTVWMRWDQTRWVLGRGTSYSEEVSAFVEAGSLSTPETASGPWQLLADKRGPQFKPAPKARCVALDPDDAVSGMDHLEGGGGGAGKGKKSVRRKRGSMKKAKEANDGRGVPAFPGSLKMESFEDGMMVLHNWSEGQQFLDGCYLRVKGTGLLSKPLAFGQHLKAAETVTLKAPGFLSSGERRAKADEDSKRWFGGDFGMPPPKQSEMPDEGVVELVSAHHMGKVVCEASFGASLDL